MLSSFGMAQVVLTLRTALLHCCSLSWGEAPLFCSVASLENARSPFGVASIEFFSRLFIFGLSVEDCDASVWPFELL